VINDFYIWWAYARINNTISLLIMFEIGRRHKRLEFSQLYPTTFLQRGI